MSRGPKIRREPQLESRRGDDTYAQLETHALKVISTLFFPLAPLGLLTTVAMTTATTRDHFFSLKMLAYLGAAFVCGGALSIAARFAVGASERSTWPTHLLLFAYALLHSSHPNIFGSEAESIATTLQITSLLIGMIILTMVVSASRRASLLVLCAYVLTGVAGPVYPEFGFGIRAIALVLVAVCLFLTAQTIRAIVLRSCELSVHNSILLDQLQTANSRLELLANTDPLTGLLNRRGWDETVANVGDRPVGFVYVDIDKFKVINDTFGHAVGDRVLCEVSHALTTGLRPGDVVARLGGDEFGVLSCVGSSAELDAVERRMNGLLVAAGASSLSPWTVTLGSGFAGSTTADQTTVEERLTGQGHRVSSASLIADSRLYERKNSRPAPAAAGS